MTGRQRDWTLTLMPLVCFWLGLQSCVRSSNVHAAGEQQEMHFDWQTAEVDPTTHAFVLPLVCTSVMTMLLRSFVPVLQLEELLTRMPLACLWLEWSLYVLIAPVPPTNSRLGPTTGRQPDYTVQLKFWVCLWPGLSLLAHVMAPMPLVSSVTGTMAGRLLGASLLMPMSLPCHVHLTAPRKLMSNCDCFCCQDSC